MNSNYCLTKVCWVYIFIIYIPIQEDNAKISVKLLWGKLAEKEKEYPVCGIM